MNKRMLKLFNDAGFHQPEMERLGIEHKFEKFVELIVRECADVCDDERDLTDSEFGKLVAEGCALKIMERFGVEE